MIDTKLKNGIQRYLKLPNKKYSNSVILVFDQIAFVEENSSLLITLLKMSHDRFSKQRISVNCLNN